MKAELIFGALRGSRPDENLRRLDTFFSAFVSLPFDDAGAAHYGQIRAMLTAAGTPISKRPVDRVDRPGQRLTVVTHDVAEFSRVPGLQLEDWEATP